MVGWSGVQLDKDLRDWVTVYLFDRSVGLMYPIKQEINDVRYILDKHDLNPLFIQLAIVSCTSSLSLQDVQQKPLITKTNMNAIEDATLEFNC